MRDKNLRNRCPLRDVSLLGLAAVNILGVVCCIRSSYGLLQESRCRLHAGRVCHGAIAVTLTGAAGTLAYTKHKWDGKFCIQRRNYHIVVVYPRLPN